MKIDGVILVDDPLDAGAVAQRLEKSGYDGGFTFEGRHDPFLPLLSAARQTKTLELSTAIAVAFARNPMTLANLGYDLQLASHGRFMLGLGSQIRPHIEKRFSCEWSKPAARMRELVLAIRAIWRSWQQGEKLDFRGEFYTHTLMTPVFNPGPCPYGLPRIFLAGVGSRMTEVAGEVGDGFFVHPFSTLESLEQITRPALKRGLEKSGRSTRDFSISVQVIVAAGNNDEELENARNLARAQISFYGSTPAYRPVLECCGYGELQTELRLLSKQGSWLEMAGLIDDDLLERIAVVGHFETIARKLHARCANLADRVSLVTPAAPDPELWSDVIKELRTL